MPKSAARVAVKVGKVGLTGMRPAHSHRPSTKTMERVRMTQGRPRRPTPRPRACPDRVAPRWTDAPAVVICSVMFPAHMPVKAPGCLPAPCRSARVPPRRSWRRRRRKPAGHDRPAGEKVDWARELLDASSRRTLRSGSSGKNNNGLDGRWFKPVTPVRRLAARLRSPAAYVRADAIAKLGGIDALEADIRTRGGCH